MKINKSLPYPYGKVETDKELVQSCYDMFGPEGEHDIGASKFEIHLAIEIRRLATPEVPLTGDDLDKWLIRDILVEVGSSYV